jgi:hypothetical protein
MPRMRATRRTQPYRKSAAGRQGGRTLAAMLKGRTGTGGNPADVQRAMQKRKRAAQATGGTLAPAEPKLGRRLPAPTTMPTRTGGGKLSKALAEQYRRRQRAARGKRRKMA